MNSALILVSSSSNPFALLSLGMSGNVNAQIVLVELRSEMAFVAWVKCLRCSFSLPLGTLASPKITQKMSES